MMYTPKKLKWSSLVEFRDHLTSSTQEKIVQFDGWKLITETTEYTIAHGILNVRTKQKELPKQKLEALGNRPKRSLPRTKSKKQKPPAAQKSRKDILEEMKARGKKAMTVSKKKK